VGGKAGSSVLPAWRPDRCWNPPVPSMRWRRSQTRPGGDSADPAIPVTLVPARVDGNKEIYHITSWPEDVGSVDLGHRVIDAIPILGHSNASIALYDRRTAILFSGDTLYPGRLYTNSYPDFMASVTRPPIWPTRSGPAGREASGSGPITATIEVKRSPIDRNLLRWVSRPWLSPLAASLPEC
jgi:hypothetical protein